MLFQMCRTSISAHTHTEVRYDKWYRPCILRLWAFLLCICLAHTPCVRRVAVKIAVEQYQAPIKGMARVYLKPVVAQMLFAPASLHTLQKTLTTAPRDVPPRTSGQCVYADPYGSLHIMNNDCRPRILQPAIRCIQYHQKLEQMHTPKPVILLIFCLDYKCFYPAASLCKQHTACAKCCL